MSVTAATASGAGPVLAIIPARGGSKGVPYKNLVSIAGHPLVAHSIGHARQALLVDRVVVSSDDDAIAAVARTYGAEVIERPPELATDDATSESALLHALEVLSRDHSYQPAYVAFLQPTSPLRPRGVIDGAIRRLWTEGGDSLFSASRQHGFVWSEDPDGLRALTYDHHARPRRQQMNAQWQENGSFYVIRADLLRRYGNRIHGRILVEPMHELDSFQIDEPDDIPLMEHLYSLRRDVLVAPIRASGAAQDDLQRSLAQVDLLLLDFDGVLTDNRVLVGDAGTEAVWCSRADGWGIARLRDEGVEIVIVSTEANRVVAARATKLGVECVQDVRDKESTVRDLLHTRGLAPHRAAFVGNDVNDLGALRCGVLPIAVADAEPSVLAAAALVTRRAGGCGAVRELADLIIRSRHSRSP